MHFTGKQAHPEEVTYEVPCFTQPTTGITQVRVYIIKKKCLSIEQYEH